jgi:hypothetical protein
MAIVGVRWLPPVGQSKNYGNILWLVEAQRALKAGRLSCYADLVRTS